MCAFSICVQQVFFLPFLCVDMGAREILSFKLSILSINMEQNVCICTVKISKLLLVQA